jgi:hypothetical protein
VIPANDWPLTGFWALADNEKTAVTSKQADTKQAKRSFFNVLSSTISTMVSAICH